MAVSEVEAVLEFLHSNGFSEAECALREEMIEKPDFSSFDFEKFVFPMVPPPPRVRITASLRRSEPEDGGKCSRSSSGDDEFVSLGTSTSGVCSSEFTNPYGLHSESRANSEASSDRLSQFGTARDYPDFDMQNDHSWYAEGDDGSFLTPSFRVSDSVGSPSEDKFVMTFETDKQCENLFGLPDDPEGFESGLTIDYLDKPCLVSGSPMDNVDTVSVTDYFHVDGELQYANGFDQKRVDGCHLSSKEPFLKQFPMKLVEDFHTYCDISQEENANTISIYSMKNGSTNSLVEEFDDASDPCDKFAEKDDCSFAFGESREENVELHGLNAADEAADTFDELQMYDNQEDEYEVFDLRIIHRKNRTGFEENKDLPIVLNTIIAGRYYVTEYLGSAAFSKVVQAHDLHTGIDVCLKIIKNDKDFFDQSLDEIKLLKLVNKHDPADQHHILRLYDYFYHQEHLFVVCELLKANLYEFQKFNQESGGEVYFSLSRLQAITRQCLEALEYLHQLGIIHCDLKPENILIKSYRRCEIKVIDLGSSCFHTDNLCLYVQSRSYRAPEVILGLPYDQKIDMWSLGCILAELCSGEVLFPNDGVVMILGRIIGMLGPIDLEMLVEGQETNKYFTREFDLYHQNEETEQLEYIIPEDSTLEQRLQVSDMRFINFLRSLLEVNPQRRPTAREALQHPWLSYSYE